MTTAAYMVEKSKEFKGLYRLTEVITTSNGVKLPGLEAFFRNKESAILHAKNMMGNKGDTLSDETGILETLSESRNKTF